MRIIQKVFAQSPSGGYFYSKISPLFFFFFFYLPTRWFYFGMTETLFKIVTLILINLSWNKYNPNKIYLPENTLQIDCMNG